MSKKHHRFGVMPGGAATAIGLLSMVVAPPSGANAAESTGAAAAVAPQVAQAPDAPGQAAARAESSQLEEVTVTARYRTEDVQQTPIAITALSGDQMEQRGFSAVTDVAAAAPNVTLLEAGGSGSGGGKSAEAFIRGVGQVDFDPAFEPGVGFYLDDVYFGNLFGSVFSLGDVDHVEILRGPQGTLFGKNNEGGAVRVYTTQPKGDNSGYVDAGYGSFNRERARGAFDIPLIDDMLFLRVSAGAEHRDGYVDVLDYACGHPATAGNLKPATTSPDCKVDEAGDEDVREFRGALRFKPNPDLDITLSADLTDDTSGVAAQKLVALNLNPGSGLGNFNQNVAIPFYGIPLDNRFLTGNSLSNYSNFCETLTGRCAPHDNTLFAFGFENEIEWNSPWGLHFKNVAAYRKDSGEYAANDSGAPITIISNDNLSDHHQFTEELDISGTLLDNRIEWTAGAYYYLGFSEYAGSILLPGLQIVPPGVLPFAPGGAYGLDFLFTDPVQVHNKSGFVHGIWHATDELSVEVGLRYSDEDKTYTFTRNELPVTPPDPIFPGNTPIPGFENHPSATSATTRFDPKVAFQYQWTPDIMTYFQVATGYKGAGINPRPVFARDVVPFGPEDLTAYEVGAKTEFLDHRLRLDTAAFLSNYKDLQLVTFTPYGSNIVANAGHVVIGGLEAEFTAKPVEGLTIDGSAGYLRYVTLHLGSAEGIADGPTEGTEPPLIPKWKLALGAQYSFDLGDLGIVTPRVDWTYQTHVFNDIANNPVGRQPGYSLVNARIGWDSADGKWSAALEGANLANKFYYVNETVDADSYGYTTGQPGLPRTFFFSVKRLFGPSAPAVAYTPPPAPAAAMPTPAVAAPGPEAERSFQVFFDFDKSDITAAAAKIIQAAADAAKTGNLVRITVTGHTDTVGSSAYNKSLSERRAAAVKLRLVADGVAEGEVATIGAGKTGLLVPTADGVREPQNRRAEIILQ